MKKFGIEVEESGFGYTQTVAFETADEAIAKAKEIFRDEITAKFSGNFRNTGRVYVQKFPTSVQEYLEIEEESDPDNEYPYDEIECVFTLGPDDVKAVLDGIKEEKYQEWLAQDKALNED